MPLVMFMFVKFHGRAGSSSDISEKSYSYMVIFRVAVCACAHAHVHVLVTPLYPTLCDPVDCSPPGSSVHGILQGRILE